MVHTFYTFANSELWEEKVSFELKDKKSQVKKGDMRKVPKCWKTSSLKTRRKFAESESDQRVNRFIIFGILSQA